MCSQESLLLPVDSHWTLHLKCIRKCRGCSSPLLWCCKNLLRCLPQHRINTPSAGLVCWSAVGKLDVAGGKKGGGGLGGVGRGWFSCKSPAGRSSLRGEVASQPVPQLTPGITESQNHRMVGVGRNLCGSSSPTLLPKQGHLQQAAQDLVQAGLEYLQRRRLHNLPGQPVPVLRHPQREEVLPHVQTEIWS